MLGKHALNGAGTPLTICYSIYHLRAHYRLMNAMYLWIVSSSARCSGTNLIASKKRTRRALKGCTCHIIQSHGTRIARFERIKP